MTAPVPSNAKPHAASGVARRVAGPSPRAYDRLIDTLEGLPARRLFLSWLGMILAFAILYWIADILFPGLREGDHAVPGGFPGLAHALYFSFVTALSIGYGDVVPAGMVRALAILEGILGLIVFGVLVSRLVGRRQEELTAEIHRYAFEDRLGRVRTNLHLVLGELQGITTSCDDRGDDPERFVPRVESASVVLAGELRAVHDLLYRPQQALEEGELAAILASLASVLRELRDVLARIPADRRSEALRAQERTIASLANEICGECVPREVAPALKTWMDRIQELSRAIV